MRRWRVGTISMGASLILLGVLLFLSQIKEVEVMTLFFSWWPFLLIVLGVEILLYLFLSKQENTLIKYDFLSIIFIGVLGTIALSCMLLSVSGLMDEVRYAVHAKEQTYDLPSYVEKVPGHIERIVLETDNQPIRLEGTKGQTLQVFGTYRTSQGDQVSSLIKKEEDYLSIHESDHTLYMKIKKLPERQGLIHEPTDAEMIVLIPVNVALELRGNSGYEMVNIRPGDLQANWLVQDGGHVNIQLVEDSNVEVRATTSSIYNESDQETTEKSWKAGDGTHKLDVISQQLDLVNVVIQGKK